MAKVANRYQSKKVLQAETDKKMVQPAIHVTDRATKRVIAPFVRIVRKSIKRVEEEAKQFSFYLQKKPSVLIRDLSSFLSDSVDLPSLLHESADVLKTVTKAAGVTLYMMDATANEIYISRRQPVDERHKIRWKIQAGSTVATYVANKKEYVMVDDILRDDRFPEGIGYDGETTKSVLCVPVVTPDGECFAVIELYRELFDGSFTGDDLKITVIVTGWMGAAVHQNSQRLALKRQQELNDYLLDLTKCYFGETVVMEKLICEVVKFARVTLAAERGAFFVLDKDNDDLIADLFEEGEDDDQTTTTYKRGTKVRFGKDRGIAGQVARTGVTVNVKDAYSDARFNKEIDQKTGFITRSILCMPIIGVDGILGVVQVVNKKNGGCFSSTDENLFKTFCDYSALALTFTKVRRQLERTTRLNNIFLKLVTLQQKPCDHDLEQLQQSSNSYIIPPLQFYHFSWYINSDDHSNMPHYVMHMMQQIIPEEELDVDKMGEFVLTVRKFYRKVPFHNFEHAFNTFHAMYTILKRNKKKFSLIEKKSLLIAALCHNVDHPGFTNNYITFCKDDLSYLYDDLILQNHHYNVTILILKNCDIFNNMSEDDKKLFYHELKQAILATDTLRNFHIKQRLTHLWEDDAFDWDNLQHRSYLKSLMMTCCDLSGQTKPFLVAKKIVDSLYVEYYRQGDIVKEMGVCCLPIMDRGKLHLIPEDQVQFMTLILLPCLDTLRNILPSTEGLYKLALVLYHTWKDIILVRGEKCWRQDDSLVEKISI